MGKFKVLVASAEIPQEVIDLLSQQCNVIVNNEKYATKQQILAKCPDADAIFWSTLLQLDADILDKAGPQLKIIALVTSGTDHVDVHAVQARGIKLFNAPKVADDAVSNLAILLMLATSRRLTEARKAIEEFSYQRLLGRDIIGCTVGVVGLGGIGQAIVTKLSQFGVERFLYSGHKEKAEGKQLKAKFVTFDQLLEDSDFVIISCPLTDETRGMFDKSAFDKMKSTAILINVARGDIVVQADLVEALQTDKIFAAGLDVTTPESLPKDHVLLKLPNVVLTPHIGNATINTRLEMAKLAARNILLGLEGMPVC